MTKALGAITAPTSLFLYSIGYASKKWTLDQLVLAAKKYHFKVVDVRLKPVSQWQPDFGQKRLVAALGKEYVWVEAFGNLNYQGGPIQLKDEFKGTSTIRAILESGYSVALLCACSKEAHCHRHIVANLITARFAIQRAALTPPAVGDKQEVVQLTLF